MYECEEDEDLRSADSEIKHVSKPEVMAGLHFMARSKLGKTLYPKPVQCNVKPFRKYEDDEFGEVEPNGNPDPARTDGEPEEQAPPPYAYESQTDRRQKSMCLRIIAGTFAVGLLVTLIFVPSLICELLSRKLTCNSTLEYGIVFGITSSVSIIVFCVVSCCCWKCTTGTSGTGESNNPSSVADDEAPADADEIE